MVLDRSVFVEEEEVNAKTQRRRDAKEEGHGNALFEAWGFWEFVGGTVYRRFGMGIA